MDLLRHLFDNFYYIVKPAVFFATRNNPERAHWLFANCLKYLYDLNLDELALNSSENIKPSSIAISNAAGFNKNGEIPPIILQNLGFERGVIGTVTYESWKGNPIPRIVRFPKTKSLVNWMEFPGIGAKAVADQLNEYRNFDIPLTINIASTPRKYGDDSLKDIEGTIYETKNLKNVDRFELNISCPNTPEFNYFMNTNDEFNKQLEDVLDLVTREILRTQQLYLKVSPNLKEKRLEEIISIALNHKVSGFTTTNSTEIHNPLFITKSIDKGGASGDAVYSSSFDVQKMFSEYINKHKFNFNIIACGGLNSISRVQERIEAGASEIQFYTPLIFLGTKYIRQLRKYFSN